MKVISKKLLRKKNNISYMKSERDILTKLHHPFIVTLHYAFQTHTKLYLIMDFLGIFHYTHSPIDFISIYHYLKVEVNYFIIYAKVV